MTPEELNHRRMSSLVACATLAVCALEERELTAHDGERQAAQLAEYQQIEQLLLNAAHNGQALDLTDVQLDLLGASVQAAADFHSFVSKVPDDPLLREALSLPALEDVLSHLKSVRAGPPFSPPSVHA